MINVVHVLNTSTFSGAENVVITVIKNMSAAFEYNCTYVSLSGSIKETLDENNINYYFLQKMNVHNLNKMIAILKPDILHCHDFTTSIMVAMTCTKKPIISHLHNNPTWIRSYNLKSFSYRLFLNRFYYVLGVSQSIFNEYVFTKYIKKYLVVSNPIDLSNIHCHSNLLKKEELQYDIIFLGRLTEQKDPLRFIEIISKLKNKLPNISAVMVGDGDLYKVCDSQIKNLDLKYNIELVGFKKNRFEYINTSKIMCITSKWEGFGLMAVEGLSFGKPIVSTNAGGLKDLINDSCGKVCITDEDFIDEIYTLLTNERYYNEKSLNSIKNAKQLENIDSYLKQLNHVYLSALKSI